MRPDQGKKVQQYLENLWGDKDLSVIDELFSPLAIIDSPLLTAVGLEGKRLVSTQWFQAFPRGIVLIDKIISTPDMVFCAWRTGGVHEDTLSGVSATGHKIFLEGTSCYRFEQNKVVEYYAHVNMGPIQLLGPPSAQPSKNTTPQNKDLLNILQAIKNNTNCTLSEREITCMSLWIMGHSAKKIANALGISIHTFQTHKDNIKGKLGVNNRPQLIEYLQVNGLLSLILYFGRHQFKFVARL